MVGFNLLHNCSLVEDRLSQIQKGQFLAATPPPPPPSSKKCNRNNNLKGISISQVAEDYTECVGLSDQAL